VQRAALTWVLAEGTVRDMRLKEDYLSVESRIPQKLWEDHGNKDSDQAYLDGVWELHGNNWDRGKCLLEVLQVNENEPSWIYDPAKRDKEMARYKRWAKDCANHHCQREGICQEQSRCTGGFYVSEIRV